MVFPESIKKLGFIFAMEGEARGLIDHFKLSKITTKASIEIYGNAQETIFVSLNGKCPQYGIDNIGTNAAVLNTYILSETVNPDLIINAGTAGGFNRAGGEIGDVYICNEKAVFHDRRIPLPQYEKYGMGYYPLIDAAHLAKELSFKEGVISTGNSLDYTSADMAIMLNHDAALKDMEAASIAWVCQQIQKPLLIVKAVTDIVNGDMETGVEFEQNFKAANAALTSKLIELTNHLMKK